jgi:hypothetical protein
VAFPNWMQSPTGSTCKLEIPPAATWRALNQHQVEPHQKRRARKGRKVRRAFVSTWHHAWHSDLYAIGKLVEERLLKEVRKAAKRLKSKNLGCIEDFEAELSSYEPQVKGPGISIDIKGKYRRSTMKEDNFSILVSDPKEERRPSDVEPYGEVAIALDKKLNVRLSDPPAGPSVYALNLPAVAMDATQAKDSARSIQSLMEMPHLARQFPLAIDLIREHCEKREQRRSKRGSSAVNVNLE